MICARLLLVIFALTPLVYAQESERIPIPMAMAALGDSISEGMLTDFSIEERPTLGQLLAMVNLARKFTGIDRMNAFRKKYARKEHSWTAGDSDSDLVNSHLERLRTIRSDIKGYNFAVSGSKSVELKPQVDDLLATEKNDDLVIDYITVLMGANDIGAEKLDDMVMPIVYEKNIELNLRRILDVNPHRMMLLVGLPHILEIFEKSEDLVAYSAFGKDYKCKDMRESVYGKAILFDRNGPNYNAAKTVLYLYRQALDNVAKHLATDYPAAHIRAIHDYDAPSLAFKTLSTDCFHPSMWGQALLSEVTWSYGFWPELGWDDIHLGP